MAKKTATCPKCASYLNAMGTCLNCHPTGRMRKPGSQDHGNSRTKKEKRGKA